MKLTKKQLIKIINKNLNEAITTDIGMSATAASLVKNKEEEAGLDISDLPAMTGATNKFAFISVPCSTAAAAAVREGGIWDSKNMYEEDDEATPYLGKYWSHVGKTKLPRRLGGSWPQRGKGSYHWSAAFVSWIMSHEDGGGPKWYKHSNHRRGYLNQAVKNRKKIEANPDNFKGQTLYVAFSGNEIIGNGNASSPKMEGYPGVGMGKLVGNNMLQPGDVIGKIKNDGGIHMDVYIGGGKKVGGNTNGASGRGYCPPKNHKDSKGEHHPGCGTSGHQPAKTNQTTDVIKRVKILGSIASYKASNIAATAPQQDASQGSKTTGPGGGLQSYGDATGRGHKNPFK